MQALFNCRTLVVAEDTLSSFSRLSSLKTTLLKSRCSARAEQGCLQLWRSGCSSAEIMKGFASSARRACHKSWRVPELAQTTCSSLGEEAQAKTTQLGSNLKFYKILFFQIHSAGANLPFRSCKQPACKEASCKNMQRRLAPPSDGVHVCAWQAIALLTIMGYNRILYGNNGKENGNYYFVIGII